MSELLKIMSTYGPLGAILLVLLYILLRSEINIGLHYHSGGRVKGDQSKKLPPSD
jgi:hypothetical protein